MPDMVLKALKKSRAPLPKDEYDLHGLVARALQDGDISFIHEAPLAPRCRIDFLCEDVGVEVKKGKPDREKTLRQMERYAKTGKIRALILVSEKSIMLPQSMHGIPVHGLALHKLWGLADAMGEEEQPLSAGTEMKIEEPLLPVQPEWEELLVICDNCGHAIRVKRQ